MDVKRNPNNDASDVRPFVRSLALPFYSRDREEQSVDDGHRSRGVGRKGQTSRDGQTDRQAGAPLRTLRYAVHGI